MEKKSKDRNIFLISLHRQSLFKNYQNSIENQIDTKKLKKNNLWKRIQKEKSIGIWGVVNTKDNYKIWKEIKKHDTIIFLHNKKFFAKSKVISTKENNIIPSQIWKEGSFIKNRNLLIFLEKIELIEFDYNSCIPTIIDPYMADAHYFGIMKVEETKKNFLVTTFGSIENAMEFLANPGNKLTSISNYLTKKQISEETEIKIKHGINKQRVGQQKFRSNVLQNFAYKCAVCKLSEKELLEAAHIIPVENEVIAGKTNNGICLCGNCHKMFDKGFFSFDKDYKIVISKKRQISNKILALLKNNQMGKYKISPSKAFLALHRAKFGI